MIFIRWFCLPIILLGALSLQAHCEPFSCERFFPVPVSEAREAVTIWLANNGFHNVQIEGAVENGGVLLKAQIRETVWSIRMHPHSALATRVEVVSEKDKNPSRLDSFWGYLEEYLGNGDPTKTSMRVIPAPVEKLRKAAVCIYAERNHIPFQLSGFAIGHQGLIATTAHDLELGQTVSIKLHDGRTSNGRVVKLDADRDLCLIKAPEFHETIVSWRSGRYMPDINDALFAFGCPASGRQSLQTGSFYGPPRRVAGQLLWQVRMQVEPGSSGSPVFDGTGRVVAVVKGRYRGAHQIGFLIPFETLLEFMETPE